jgi:hypothetical protein
MAASIRIMILFVASGAVWLCFLAKKRSKLSEGGVWEQSKKKLRQSFTTTLINFEYILTIPEQIHTNLIWALICV